MSALPDDQFLGFEQPPKPRRRLALAVWILAILGLLAVAHYLEPPDRSLAWIAFFDAGHAPLFGAIALAILHLLLATPLANRSRPLLYGSALGLAILMGILSELMQIGANRNSDPWDLGRDALGASSFLLFAATRDPFALLNLNVGRGVRTTCRGVAVASLALAFAPGAWVAYAYAQRAAAFPALCDFEGTWETNFVATKHARLAYTSLPDASGRAIAVAQLSFEPTGSAAFKLLEPYPDWAGYQSLRLSAQLESDHPIELVLRIHDRWHNGHSSDRFRRVLTFLPGANEFTVSLAEIRSAPDGREMDLSAIRRLNVYARRPIEGASLYLIELGLN